MDIVGPVFYQTSDIFEFGILWHKLFPDKYYLKCKRLSAWSLTHSRFSVTIFGGMLSNESPTSACPPRAPYLSSTQRSCRDHLPLEVTKQILKTSGTSEEPFRFLNKGSAPHAGAMLSKEGWMI